ncbi:aminoglycoside phosphotransferase family protein [Actinomadura logoneensis]|uniref:Aminoglycoside phosphotransferase family protein n=2 Tax=Actinomadura logoneensis TaxID=2293572 RepID=A0A372JT25_9ACTN|nr:aminoglycoside phosphotransferase family protein [Actinomadura logoneensis]
MDLVTRSPALAPALALPVGAPPSPATVRWVRECFGRGAEIRAIRPLPGGTAHANHALVVESGSGSEHRLVLRRWLPRDPLAPGGIPGVSGAVGTSGSSAATVFADGEFSPEREIAALTLLAACEIPTPALVAADPAGAHCDAPALLLTRLPGHPPRPVPDDLPEVLIQLAAALLPVHALRGAASMPPYIPRNRLDLRQPPKHATRPELWERACEIASGPAPDAPSRFVHRDYHPDNTLWSRGRLTGVVDWSDASSGPVGVDVGQMRLRLALRYGVRVADRFRECFDQVAGGHDQDPYWDLRCLLDLLPEEPGRVLSERDAARAEEYLQTLL